MKKKVIAIMILLLIIIFGVGGCYFYVYNNAKKWTNLIYPGVKVGDVDISGKTLVEAKKLITEKYGEAVLKKNINIKTPTKTYLMDYTKINARYNIDEVVAQAFDYGKNLKLYERYKLINKPINNQFNLKFAYDPKPLNEMISNMKKEIDKEPVEGSIALINGSFKITADKKGAKLLDDKLEKEILSKINGDVEVPDIVVEAEVETVLANKTTEKLQSVNTIISSFSTNFSSSPYGRSTNITLAAKSINGTFLMPGQSFSFNGTVGQRTPAKGYQQAPVDIGTKVAMDYGGGICQVSTSLYNTVIRANVKSTVRNHHTIPSTYIPLGMDATVDWGNLDYAFTNTLEFPIFIQSIVKDKILTWNLYSNSSLMNKSYNLVNEIYETVKPGPTRYIDDPTLFIGETVQDQFPLTGYKVRVYKDTIQNGKVIEHQLISDDQYKVTAEVIKRGTKVR
ncbi:MAG: VanW family protein [Clostridiaceae bacterium]|nr:VanW family protein [Clostridiaceae bacterium]